MGGALGTEKGATVYTRTTTITQMMDEVRDKKKLKLKLIRKVTNDPKVLNNGKFTLTYEDDVSDVFQSIKCVYKYTGSYFVETYDADDGDGGVGISSVQETDNDRRDSAASKRRSTKGRGGDRQFISLSAPLAVGTPTSTDGSSKSLRVKTLTKKGSYRSDMAVDANDGSNYNDLGDSASVNTAASNAHSNASKLVQGAPPGKTVITRFKVESLRCNLSDEAFKTKWVIVHDKKPDCIEDHETGNLVWEWPGVGKSSLVPNVNVKVSSKEVLHGVPFSELDFVGEEDPHTGSLHLHVRIPELCTVAETAALQILPLGGWDLIRKQ